MKYADMHKYSVSLLTFYICMKKTVMD